MPQQDETNELKAQVAALTKRVAYLEDRQAIRDVLQRYARGLDRHDVEIESAAFWPDAQVNYGTYSGLRDDFVKWGNDGHEASFVRHEHHITTQNVDIAGDVAHAESYVIYLLREKNEAHTVIGGARYIDRLERRGGEWRIALREFLPDILIRGNSTFASEYTSRMLPPSGEGTWDRSDLSYRRPLTRRPGAQGRG